MHNFNHEATKPPAAEVFISYSSRDRERVIEIVSQLESAGVSVWVDRDKIEGGMIYGPKIVRGIKDCKVLMLMCTDASMRSRNVTQEILIAWKHERCLLPLLLEQTSYSEQLEYWLEGRQWIEVMNYPTKQWLPRVLRSLTYVGVQCHSVSQVDIHAPIVQPTRLHQGWNGLLSVAKFTDQIWPVPADCVQRGTTRSALRGLGAPQDGVQRVYQLGSRVCLAIESDREGHLLLLDKGPEGILYCLCPSFFAHDTHLRPGRTYLPQERSRYDSFVITGKPGREELLAVITDEPLGLDWMPTDPKIPARVLTPADIDTLLALLRDLQEGRWTALSTYFDLIA